MYRLLKNNESGLGLVGAMLLLSILGLLALMAVQMAVSSRRTSFNEQAYLGAFESADSGSEAAIGWLARTRGIPPIQDFSDMTVSSVSSTNLRDSQNFDFDVAFVRRSARLGYDLNHADFVYDIDAIGQAYAEGRSNIEVVVRKLNRQGYQGY